jgi:hypothetical protein
MPNSVKARLKKLEDRVHVFGPHEPHKVCYLLVSREQYEEAMAIGNTLPFENKSGSRLVLTEEEWRNNDKLVILDVLQDRSISGSH